MYKCSINASARLSLHKPAVDSIAAPLVKEIFWKTFNGIIKDLNRGDELLGHDRVLKNWVFANTIPN